VIDHQKRHTRIQVSLFSADANEKARLTQRIETLHEQLNVPPAPLPVESVSNMRCDCNQSDEEYGAVVRQMQKAIRAGEIFQVVPSRRFTLPCPSPLAAYEVLKKSNPSPYMFFMQDSDFACLAHRRKARSNMTPPRARLKSTLLPGHAHAVVALTVRWIGIWTAVLNSKCVPTIKSYPST
jgi:hypothetical protein